MKDLLELYTNPKNPGSFSGVENFYKNVKNNNINIKKSELEKFLSEHPVYTLHKPITKKFKRNQIIANGINELWEIDLVDMKKYANENNQFKYILTCIDVFSKVAYAEPIKLKNDYETTEGFKKILKKAKTEPKKIHVDKGNEFFNKPFKNLLQKYDIHMYSTNSEMKAAIVERFNRTLKEKMWRMFTYNGSHVYYKYLKDLIDSYNNTYHRSIKTTPNKVNKSNEQKIWFNLYGYDYDEGDDNIVISKYNVGDYVRITKYKGIFAKGYESNWTNEIFKIKNVIYRSPVVYKLCDLENQELEGIFYEKELQKVYQTSANEDEYEVLDILKYRKKDNKVLIKWYDNSETWEPIESVLRNNNLESLLKKIKNFPKQLLN